MNTPIKPKAWQDRGHGSPYDRGSADAYYGRRFNPHWREYPKGLLGGECVEHSEDVMTPEQLEDYRLGYVEEYDRKDW